MRGRIGEWVRFAGSRYAVAGCLLAVLSGIALLPLFAGIVVRTASPLYYVCSGLITGNITLVTVVVAITQLVLSRELESPGELRTEIEQTADYRREALDRRVVPTEPDDFLRELADQIREETRSLEEAIGESSNRELRAETESIATDLPDHCDDIEECLEDGTATLFEVVAPTLGAPYADYLREVQRLRATFDESHERVHDVLDPLASDLEDLDVARQYVTTMVIKEELARMSRSLLYVGIPAVAVPIAVLVQLTAYAGSPFRPADLVALLVLLGIAGLGPLALFSSFVLRIATVAQQIASITPFESRY